jgi:ABC-type transport system involved in Fe-S cluster assembly fused permease/ATPase subunit
MPDGYNTLVGERGLKLSGGGSGWLLAAGAELEDARLLLNRTTHTAKSAMTIFSGPT